MTTHIDNTGTGIDVSETADRHGGTRIDKPRQLGDKNRHFATHKTFLDELSPLGRFGLEKCHPIFENPLFWIAST
jgi:hypothetical protein